MPRVTIILSTFNWSSVLPYSIGSVLRQDYSDWELLVIGDCCTDDSESIVQRTIAGHPAAQRVRWINLPQNAGNQFGPNNEGLRQASGEFIAYLGHDDLWLPHHLSCLINAMDAGADIAHSVIRWVEPASEGKRNGGLLFSPSECIAPSAVMHRRSVTEALGGWRDFRTISEAPDADLWTRARNAGLNFSFVPRLTVVKFPAYLRRDVYRHRPSHEQAAWFARIERESDLEETELVKMLCDVYQPEVPFFHELSNLLRRGVSRFAQRRRKKSHANGEKIDAWRNFKGLESKQ